MNELPLGWKIIPLSQAVLEIRNGISAKPDNSSGLPILRISAVRPMRLDIDDVRFLPHDFPVTKYRLQTGDLLFTRYNGNREFVGVCARVRQVFRETVYPDKLIRVRVNRDVALPEFVEGAVHAGLSRSFIQEKLKTSAGQVGISGADLLSVPMPLPPLPEQKRIADKLDRLLARVDACRERLDRVPALLKRFRQSVLAAATSGELTREWREERGQQAEGTGLPATWVERKIGELGNVQLGRQRSPKFHSGDSMRPYLRVQNVFEDRIDISDVMEMNFPPEDIRRYELKHGDILLNEGQSPQYLGRPAMYRDEIPGACFTNTLIRFQANPELVLPEYALLVFRHHMHSGRYVAEGNITTNIAHLGAGRFASVEFPLPPLDEQQEISNRAQFLFDLAASLEQRLRGATALANKTIPATLAKAFRGELVPQDPTDEPAAALLARIAEINATESKGAQRKKVIANPVDRKDRAKNMNNHLSSVAFEDLQKSAAEAIGFAGQRAFMEAATGLDKINRSASEAAGFVVRQAAFDPAGFGGQRAAMEAATGLDEMIRSASEAAGFVANQAAINASRFGVERSAMEAATGLDGVLRSVREAAGFGAHQAAIDAAGLAQRAAMETATGFSGAFRSVMEAAAGYQAAKEMTAAFGAHQSAVEAGFSARRAAVEAATGLGGYRAALEALTEIGGYRSSLEAAAGLGGFQAALAAASGLGSYQAAIDLFLSNKIPTPSHFSKILDALELPKLTEASLGETSEFGVPDIQNSDKISGRVYDDKSKVGVRELIYLLGALSAFVQLLVGDELLGKLRDQFRDSAQSENIAENNQFAAIAYPVSLRSDPAEDSFVIMELKPDSWVRIKEVRNEWLLIDFYTGEESKISGWVPKESVKKLEEIIFMGSRSIINV